MEKYGLLDPEEYDKQLQAQQETLKSDNNRAAFAQLGASLGDMMAGRDTSKTNAAFDTIRKGNQESTVGNLEARRKSQMDILSSNSVMDKMQRDADMFDPNSERSIAFRNAFKSASPSIAAAYGDKFDQLTAGDSDNSYKWAALREGIDARKQNAQILSGQRQEALNLKSQEKEEKKKQSVVEIQDRYNNIKDSIASLGQMIKNNGTQEMFGPENKNMEQYIEAIATDMAKLVDPSSVAREAEVASFKRMLFEPGFWQRESTVKGVLNNFEKMVDKRLKNAYEVRGLEMPTEKQTGTKDREAEQYAQMHGISYDQALAIKAKRTSQQAGR